MMKKKKKKKRDEDGGVQGYFTHAGSYALIVRS